MHRVLEHKIGTRSVGICCEIGQMTRLSLARDNHIIALISLHTVMANCFSHPGNRGDFTYNYNMNMASATTVSCVFIGTPNIQPPKCFLPIVNTNCYSGFHLVRTRSSRHVVISLNNSQWATKVVPDYL